MCIWGILGNIVPKNARVAHVCNFPSKKMEMANGVLKLKISKILLGYIATF
jgi:hypothetical protein